MAVPLSKDGGTWSRYKIGQAQFTSWLKQAADKFMPSRARTAQGKQYLGLKDLEPLAKTVVEHTKPDDIPYTPITVLREVLDLRRKSSTFYAKSVVGNGQDEDREQMRRSNETHRHVIRVLERVLDIFERAVAGRGGLDEEEKARPLDLNVLDNMYRLLKLQVPEREEEEPEEEEPVKTKVRTKTKRGKKIKPSKKPQKKKAKAEKKQADDSDSWVDTISFTLREDEDEEPDLYLLIYCFFLDFNIIRDHLCERWCDYFYDKSRSLTSLCVITNAACALFEEMEEEFNAEWEARGPMECDDDMPHFENLMGFLWFDYGLDHVETSEHDDDDFIFRNEGRWLGFNAWRAVSAALENIPQGKTPMLPPSMRPAVEYNPETLEEQMAFDDSVAMGIILEATQLKAMKVNGLAPPHIHGESDLLVDFFMVLITRYMAPKFVFEMQLYLDIRHILEEQVEHSFQQLQATGRKYLPILQEMHTEKGLLDRKDKVMTKHLMELIQQCVLTDWTLSDKKARLATQNITEDVPEFETFRIEPIWPGLLDFYIKMAVTLIGLTTLINDFDFIEAVSFYREFRDPARNQWPEMDKFLALYTVPRVSKPGAASDMSKLADLQDSDMPFLYKEVAERQDLMVVFLEQYGRDNMVDTDYIREICGGFLSAKERRRKYERESRYNVRGMGADVSDKTTSSEEKSGAEHKTFTELLDILEQAAKSVEQDIAINHFALRRECIAFVGACIDDLGGNRGGDDDGGCQEERAVLRVADEESHWKRAGGAGGDNLDVFA